MTIPTPNLDDVNFDEIFEQIRHKIPQFSDSWTDHNFSDPGITFIELFSWLAEMQIFSLNTVSKNSYLKFLKNLGYSPKPPSPTTLVVNFLPSKKLKNFIVPKGAIFVSDVDGEKIFQSDESFEILPCHLESAYVYRPNHGYLPLDNLEFEKNDVDFEPRPWNLTPFGADPDVGRSFCLGFADLDKYTGKTFRFFIKMKYDELEKFPVGTHGDEPVFCSSPGCMESDSLEKLSPIVWEWATKLDASGQPEWKSLDVLSTTNHLSKSGIVSFTIPFEKENKFRLGKNPDSNNDSELFWIRCSLVNNLYETSPIIDGVYANPLLITSGQVSSKPDRHFTKFFTSNGLSNQKFVLHDVPVIQIHSLSSVSHSDSFSDVHHRDFWSQVNTFDYSNGTDKHFMVNFTTGEIIFGDGEKGKIPEKNSTFDVVYRHGSSKVNIQDNTEFNLYVGDELVEKITKSRFIAHLGNENESLESLYYRARSDLSVPYTAVTSEDFEYVAKSTPGLRISRTTATVNPNMRNTVDITVIPYSTKSNPLPKKSLLDCVCRHVDKHRLLTTSIRVLPPNYVEVTVKVVVRTTTGVSKGIIEKKLNQFLSPISKGYYLSGWPVGRSVYKSEIIALINQIDGVDCIESISLLGKDNVGSFTYDGENIVITNPYKTNTFVFLGNHNVRIVHSQQSCKNNGGNS